VSILGAVIRVRPEQLPSVVARLHRLPGVDVSLNPGDGRLVLVIEDIDIDRAVQEAANTLEQIAQWRDVLNTSLVYEYSGPDVPATAAGVSDYRDWRGSLAPQRPATASIENEDLARTRAQR
jgi:periplasmic nitrate reductase NapD